MTLLRPDPLTFRSGDLVWPKADNQIVYYLVGGPQEALWLEQRDAFVARVDSDPQASAQDKALADQVRDWRYADFASFPPPGHEIQANLIRPWVGHVGIIDLRGGQPWVVDATPSRKLGGVEGRSGVADQTYEDWLADDSHLQSHVWHGRLPAASAAQATAIVACAMALSLDGGQPERRFWVSPLQLMRCSRVHLLYVPAGREYGA